MRSSLESTLGQGKLGDLNLIIRERGYVRGVRWLSSWSRDWLMYDIRVRVNGREGRHVLALPKESTQDQLTKELVTAIRVLRPQLINRVDDIK